MLNELVKKGDVIKVYEKRQETGELIEYDIPCIIKGKVYRILSDKEMEMITEQKEPELQKNVCYILHLFSYEKVFLCNTYYHTSYTEDHRRVISFELLSPLERVQRRMHQRISSHAKFLLCRLEKEIAEKMLQKEPGPADLAEESQSFVYTEETMIDISAGGIRMTSKEPVQTGDYVHIIIDIKEQENVLGIRTYGQVIYSEVFRNEQGVYDVRLKFIGISEQEKEKIIHYVFGMEREKRKTGGRVT